MQQPKFGHSKQGSIPCRHHTCTIAANCCQCSAGAILYNLTGLLSGPSSSQRSLRDKLERQEDFKGCVLELSLRTSEAVQTLSTPVSFLPLFSFLQGFCAQHYPEQGLRWVYGLYLALAGHWERARLEYEEELKTEMTAIDRVPLICSFVTLLMEQREGDYRAKISGWLAEAKQLAESWEGREAEALKKKVARCMHRWHWCCLPFTY